MRAGTDLETQARARLGPAQLVPGR